MDEGGLDEHGEVLTFSRRGRYVPRSVGSRARRLRTKIQHLVCDGAAASWKFSG